MPHLQNQRSSVEDYFPEIIGDKIVQGMKLTCSSRPLAVQAMLNEYKVILLS